MLYLDIAWYDKRWLFQELAIDRNKNAVPIFSITANYGVSRFRCVRNHTYLKQDKQNYYIADIFLKVLKLLA